MSPILSGLLIGGAYLLACGVALAFHELAHYVVHRRHAESVKLGFNWKGPYTDSTYARTAPTYAIRLGSIAPTLIYGPLSIAAIVIYLQHFAVPHLSLFEWSLVLTPLALLVVPTASDLYGFLYAHR